MRHDENVTISAEAPQSVACTWCGVCAADLPVTWSIQTSPRGVEYLCEACTRTNVRGIEGQLPSEYW
jgi:hypothetical protein